MYRKGRERADAGNLLYPVTEVIEIGKSKDEKTKDVKSELTSFIF